ncbi:uncharacterized protein [Dermacentor andersoni]|uniref:uncharacterized protein n=1 Tax=Dermacentor andersoni TaxID=34620 RepID=UPI002417C3C9|nr:uncharacterized protein LOC126522639 [Dermacentor andersoni]XP_054922490.1 uncharacterized protein LOC126522639 [Dermacentor andersoni]
MTFDPHQGMPESMLRYRLKLLQNNGYHLYYPYGRKLPTPSEYLTGTLREPLYDGWTFRVFFCAHALSHETELKITWESADSSSWFIRIWVNTKGEVATSGHDTTGNFSAPMGVQPVQNGDYYTLAIRYEGSSLFRVLFNADQGSGQADKKRDMQDIQTADKWHFKISPGSHYLLAVDISDELGKFPQDGLKQEYYHNAFPMDIGSFGIFELTYTGNDEVLLVDVSEPGAAARNITFRRTNMRMGETFLAYIRCAPTGWVLQMSFQDQAVLALRPKNDRSLSPKFSAANIMRMYLEPGPLS